MTIRETLRLAMLYAEPPITNPEARAAYDEVKSIIYPPDAVYEVWLIIQTKYTERFEKIWAFSSQDQANQFAENNMDLFDGGHELTGPLRLDSWER